MWKVVRTKLYDLLNSKAGLLAVVIGGFGCVIAGLLCIHAIVDSFHPISVKALGDQELTANQPCHLIEGTCAARFSDNIVGKSFEEELCAPVFDVVYTWVNGSDPRLQAELREYKEKLGLPSLNEIQSDNGTKVEDQKGNSNRYRDNQELRYSLRSIWKFAPWIRQIFIVTNYQVPYWLNIDHPKITIVPHSTIFKNKSHLPVFSSPAIESHLHRIPGLAKKFIYFNDDVMLGNTIWPSDFYTNAKGQKVYLSWDIPQCAPGCPEAWLADKYCDKACNTSMCNWDEGDCRLINGTRYTSWHNSEQANVAAYAHANVPQSPSGNSGGNSGESNSSRDSSTTEKQISKKKCHRFCPDSWIGDKVCDSSCNRIECAFDAGDCGAENIAAEILGLTVEDDKSLTKIPDDAMSFYVNLTGMFDMVLDASHDNQEFVRTAVITQELQILVFLLHEKPYEASWEESIEVYLEGEYQSSIRNVTFLVMRSSAVGAGVNTTVSEEHIEDSSGTTARTSTENVTDASEGLLESTGASRTLLWLPVESEEGIQYEPTGDLFARVEFVTSVPSEDGRGVVHRDAWTEKDKELAKLIGKAKRKSLALELLEEARFQEQKDIDQAYQMGYRKTSVALPNEMRRRVLNRVEGWLDEEVTVAGGGPAGRRLLEDTFGNSLRYVNSLYRARYGSEQRKAPAHMPHMIDRDIMEELQNTFPEEFEATSSNRFRDSSDMQFSFSYFYYLMNEKPKFDLESVYKAKLDLDENGNLDLLEIRHFALILMQGKPTIHGMRAKISQLLDDLGIPSLEGQGPNGGELQDRIKNVEINIETIRSSPKVINELKKYMRKQTKHRHELVNLSEVEFFMVPDDYEEVRKRLDDIMVKAPKFICLNDDMNKTHDPPANTLQALRDFYETYYPHRTPFELAANESNPYLHYEDLMAYKQKLYSDKVRGST